MDNSNAKNQKRLATLNQIFAEYDLPRDLYFQLRVQISVFDDQKTVNENKNFLAELPIRLKIQTCMYIYSEYYEQIPYLQGQSEGFLGWICPHLKQVFYPADQYIF